MRLDEFEGADGKSLLFGIKFRGKNCQFPFHAFYVPQEGARKMKLPEHRFLAVRS